MVAKLKEKAFYYIVQVPVITITAIFILLLSLWAVFMLQDVDVYKTYTGAINAENESTTININSEVLNSSDIHISDSVTLYIKEKEKRYTGKIKGIFEKDGQVIIDVYSDSVIQCNNEEISVDLIVGKEKLFKSLLYGRR